MLEDVLARGLKALELPIVDGGKGWRSCWPACGAMILCDSVRAQGVRPLGPRAALVPGKHSTERRSSNLLTSLSN